MLLTAGAAVLAAAAGTFTFRGTESAPPLLQFSPTAVASDPATLLHELVATTAEGNDVPTTVGYLLWNTTGFVADLHSRP